MTRNGAKRSGGAKHGVKRKGQKYGAELELKQNFEAEAEAELRLR